MLKEYTVKGWKAWKGEDGNPVTDTYGNFMGTLTFDEHNSEPVDGRFKNEPSVGDKLFGAIEQYQTKKGDTRLKFKRAPKDGGKFGNKRDDARIEAQWAVGQASQKIITSGEKFTPALLFKNAQNFIDVQRQITDYIKGLDNGKTEVPDKPAQDKLPSDTEVDNPIDLGDIPF